MFFQTWLVGDGWNEDEQLNAPEGTLFIPFSQFPLKKMRKDCFYHSTPAMVTPKSFTNMHSCEVSKELTFLPFTVKSFKFSIQFFKRYLRFSNKIQ